MIKIIENPNLPCGKVKHCLIGERYKEEIIELTELGVECITLKENPLLNKEISAHADILSYNFGGGKILADNNAIGEEQLKKTGITVQYCDSVISSPYPKDIPLNVARMGDNIICNKKYTHKSIIEHALQQKLNIINTNQGYSKCNLCILNEKAVITEDHGLGTLLKNYQFDVLEIPSGDVYLSDEHYGFLGGASCKLSENIMYFSGNIEKSRAYSDIINFLNKYNITPIYNKNRNLRDFGGIIQLTEKI